MAQAQDTRPGMRPPVGGVASSKEAMIFYLARGPLHACGTDCSEWIVAEGAVQWDSHKRLLTFLDRHPDTRRPIVIDSFGRSTLSVAMSLGRIIRARGFRTTVGITEPIRCSPEHEARCFEIKREQTQLEANLRTAKVTCDVACVFVLAGGNQRYLPPDTQVVFAPLDIRSRRGVNIPALHREHLMEANNEKSRRYLNDMGVDPELLNLLLRSTDLQRRIQLRRSDWLRLRLVNEEQL
jgi:hypothetical protein